MDVVEAPPSLLDEPEGDPWCDPALAELRARHRRAERTAGPARVTQLARQVAEYDTVAVVATHAQIVADARPRKRSLGAMWGEEPEPEPESEAADPRWFAWADGAGPSCRVLFVKEAASAMDRDGLFADGTPEAGVLSSLVAAGVRPEQVAALNVVPWPHAGQWGEYNRPPEACLATYAPYAADLVKAIRPAYVVTHTKGSTDLVQRGLDPRARRPEVVDAGHMARVHVWPTKEKPTLLRLMHPWPIRADAQAQAERADAVVRLCTSVAPRQRPIDTFAVLMGRERLGLPSGRGRLRWAAGDLIGAVAMPEPAALDELGRLGVGLLVNLTPRAVPAAVCKRGRLRQLVRPVDLAAELAAALPEARNGRVLLVCATGHASAAAAAVVSALGAGTLRAVGPVLQELYERMPRSDETADAELAMGRQDESEAPAVRCADAGCARVVGRSPTPWHDAWRLWWARQGGHRQVSVDRSGGGSA